MKKIIAGLGIVTAVLAISGADFRRNGSAVQSQTVIPTKKKCIGFTIIEFGKGINCNGDTVKLKRVNGVQVLAEN